MVRIRAAFSGELGPGLDYGRWDSGVCHHKEALLSSSQQEGRCGQEARGPPGKRGLGAQYFQACRFLQCLNREGLRAGLPEKNLFTFACGTEEN